MKINFGIYKHRNIEFSKNLKMRPTTSIAKSIIFNTIELKENDLVFDLFSGTGALGLESLSLGAQKVIFCDVNFESVQAIKKTLINLQVPKENYEIFSLDFRRTIILNKTRKFNIIFLDPPFSVEKYYSISLELIYKNNLLSNDGFLILEKPKKLIIQELDLFKIYKIKKIGEKEIYFLEKKDE